MDDGNLTGIAIALLMILRFINNLVRASSHSLGMISLIALAEKVREQNKDLALFLNDPVRLNYSGQAFDKFSLLFLILIWFWPSAEAWTPFWWFVVYLSVSDLLVPNILATSFPVLMITKLYRAAAVLHLLVRPFSRAMKAFADRGKNDPNEDNPEDIHAFLRAGTEEGIIEEKEKLMIHNLLNFTDTIVREVMTPRTDMICVDISMSHEEVLEVFKRTKFSRVPVYRDDIDHIEGMLRFKDFFELMSERKSLASGLKELMFIPEKMNINDLLQGMLKRRLHMAIVVDEFGGTSGLTTLEDLIEEIVGEIHDEHEEPEADEIIDLNDGSYLVDGKVLLEDFCDLFSIGVAEKTADTVGGFIFHREGRIPNEGETCSIGELDVEIAKADERRIYKVKVTPSREITVVNEAG